ncbi:MAG: SH3 domain-containing protein [Sulfuricella sp.]|nr:SH3 domain-containing protein [Sulfuricella sp.]
MVAGWFSGRHSRLARLALLLSFCFSGAALALDYRSVGAESATLYDSPSVQGKRLFVADKYYPVEIIVNLDQWAKVRDVTGILVWIEKKNLSSVRTVLVTAARADVRQAADPKAPLVFQAERDVALELVEHGTAGWLKVRHRDGQVGFVLSSQVWGS